MTELQKRLFDLSDKEYGDFQAKLTPTISRDKFIGVRMPVLREFAKDYSKEDESITFLDTLPHDYYEENMLHGILLGYEKDYSKCIQRLNAFLPYVDNWAVSDTTAPKVLNKYYDALITEVKSWINTSHVYTCRFGICMLMRHYLDKDFKKEYLELPAKVESDEYYINMIRAWFYATALAKQWDATIPYIENHCLDNWTHKKAIQKAIESYRITDNQKQYLKTLK